MGRVEIAPVTGRRELEAFVALPYQLHRRDPCFTPPLRRDVRAQLDATRNGEAGLLVDGFETPSVVMMPHNPAHYPQLVEGSGLRKLKDLLAFENTSASLPARLVKATEIVKPVVIPELVIFAEAKGEPIGFAATIPDVNVALRANPSGRLFPGLLKVVWASRGIARLRVLLLGVLPEWRGRGIDALLCRRIWENGCARDFAWAEAGWVLEDNHAMINALHHVGFRAYKTYRIYERAL